jgi:hypothetical protein
MQRSWQQDLETRDHLASQPLIENLETFAREALETSPWIFSADIVNALAGVNQGIDVSAIIDGLDASRIVEAHIRRHLSYFGLVEANRVGMAIVMAWNAKLATRERHLKAYAYLNGGAA